MVASTTPRPARERRLFLDAVRGWALILTVLHHTSRLWQDAVMRWPRYYLSYFTHHLIVLTLINQWLGERFNNWWSYSAANALLVLLLVAMGRGWQEVKRWYRDHGPALGVFGRA